MILPLVSRTRPKKFPANNWLTAASRCIHHSTRLPAIAASNSRARPTLQPLHQPSTMLRPTSVGGSRSIFIQTENTPNPDALKFLPNHPILPPGLSTPFIEYLTPRSTLAPPFPSPLAANLMNIDGITAVFYGTDFITVTKAADANWAHVKPEVFSLITEAVTSGQQIVNVSEQKPGESGQEGNEEDSLWNDQRASRDPHQTGNSRRWRRYRVSRFRGRKRAIEASWRMSDLRFEYGYSKKWN
jgi:hypothetical protein